MAEQPRAEPPRKEFGRRGQAPPVVTHAPGGLTGAASDRSPLRKRSLAIAAIAVGSLSIGGLALLEHTRRDCPEGADPERQDCSHSSSHGGSGGHSYSSGSSSSSHSSSGESAGGHSGAGSSAHAVSFGGFGHAGAGHGGGGS